MKKILIIILSLFFIFLSANKETKNEEIVMSKNFDFAYENEYIKEVSKYPDVDYFMQRELTKINNRIIKQYAPKKVYIKYDQKTTLNKAFICYVYDITISSDDEILQSIKKIFNFEVTSKKQIVLNDVLLEDIYLPLLNNDLKKYNLKLNRYDMKVISYIIEKKQITFYIPSEITFNEEIKIVLKNKGFDYKPLLIEESKNNIKLAALTFDDGPSTKTKEIVDLLNDLNIKATFYLLGERVSSYRDEVLYIEKNNHEIGNHSYSHLNFSKLSVTESLDEINKTQEAIYNITKSYPKTFRFPYGSYNKSSLNYINLPVVLWSVDSEDWKYLNNNIIISNVIDNLIDKSVLLFHDNSHYKKDALISVIMYLKNKGYQFVSVSELYEFYNLENYISGKVYY